MKFYIEHDPDCMLYPYVNCKEENIMLILVIGHQIHQHIGDQQNIALIAPCEKRQTQHRQHSQVDKLSKGTCVSFLGFL